MYVPLNIDACLQFETPNHNVWERAIRRTKSWKTPL